MFEEDPLIAATIALVAATYVVLLFRLYKRPLAFDTITWWPLFMYVPGPLTIQYLYSEHPAFTSAFSEVAILWATEIMLAGFVIYSLFLAKPVSRQIKRELDVLSSSSFADGPIWPFILLGIVCIGFQIMLIVETGSSILTGKYVMQGFVENSRTFIVTAGFYELFAGLGAIRLIVSRATLRENRKFILWYSAVLIVRVLGGTRLIVIKALFFFLFIGLCQRRFAVKKVLTAALAIAVMLMAVGLLRTDPGAQSNLSPGALFFAEGALNNLCSTLVIDDALGKGVMINWSAIPNALSYIMFIVIHLIPNFIYEALGGGRILLGEWGFYRSWAEPYFPFRDVLMTTGLDTVSPLGGQSIVALGVVLFGVLGAPLVIPFVYLLFYVPSRFLTKFAPIMLLLGFEAPSIFRDSSEILAKELFVNAAGFVVFRWLAEYSARRKERQSDVSHTLPTAEVGTTNV